jgi:plastocyanin
MRTVAARGLWLAAAVTLVSSCGGGDSAPSGSGGGTTGPTITITASGVSPRTVTITPGTQVTFTNNDGRSHFMASDPHPTHEDCTEINSVEPLATGQSRQTGNMNTVRSCGFHDHDNPTNTGLQGSIIIQ